MGIPGPGGQNLYLVPSYPQKDEMEVEHLATLERLRQNQRQDYLKVSHCVSVFVRSVICNSPPLTLSARIRVRFVRASHRPTDEGAA